MYSTRAIWPVAAFITGLLAWVLSRLGSRFFSMTGSSTAITRSFASALSGRIGSEMAVRSFLCTDCGRTFTFISAFKSCPFCKTANEASDEGAVYSVGKVKKVQESHREFERRYAQRDNHRKRMGYPSPESRGRKEAQVLRDLEERFKAA